MKSKSCVASLEALTKEMVQIQAMDDLVAELEEKIEGTFYVASNSIVITKDVRNIKEINPIATVVERLGFKPRQGSVGGVTANYDFFNSEASIYLTVRLSFMSGSSCKLVVDKKEMVEVIRWKVECAESA